MHGGQRPGDDFCRFGDVQPAGRLEQPAQGNIGEITIISKPGVIGVIDMFKSYSHLPTLSDERAYLARNMPEKRRA